MYIRAVYPLQPLNVSWVRAIAAALASIGESVEVKRLGRSIVLYQEV